ncbi:MAG: PhnD/SsuA/transferrin family substrate-binding protein [Sulfuricaulis sp.]
MKRRQSFHFLLLAGAVLLTLFVGNALAAGREFRFGSVAMDIPADMYRRLMPLTDYLSQALGRPVTLKLSPSMSDAIDQISTGQVNLSYLTPVAYIVAHARSGARLIVKPVMKNGHSFRLMIVVRSNSPIRRIADLKGKFFAFGDKAAVLQRAVVVHAGMPLEQLGGYRFIGHYDNIAQGVMSGDFDAGILTDAIAYAWQGKGLRILYQSPDLPSYNISASARVSDKMLKQLREAFLKLDINNPSQRVVIQALDPAYSGFATVSDKDYNIVRHLIAPFAEK